MNELLQHINPVYFWDVEFSKLDVIKNKRLIIERVINFGNLQEWHLLKNTYGESDIIHTLINLNYLDAKTQNFVSLIFKIPPKNMKCYTNRQLKNTHWS